MTKLEIACVVCGLIGILVYQPSRVTLGDIMVFIMLIVRNLCFMAMIILPLYFRLWR